MSSLDALALRRAFGRFATGVTVVTVDTGEVPLGITVNSFASLSLEPPLLLWNLQRDSDCFDVFTKVEHYAVNVLHAGQQPLSEACARKGDHVLAKEHWQAGESGCPVLCQSLACFECAVRQRHDGGDHIILVGEVLFFRNAEGGAPLLFYGGTYHTLAEDDTR